MNHRMIGEFIECNEIKVDLRNLIESQRSTALWLKSDTTVLIYILKVFEDDDNRLDFQS